MAAFLGTLAVGYGAANAVSKFALKTPPEDAVGDYQGTGVGIDVSPLEEGIGAILQTVQRQSKALEFLINYVKTEEEQQIP